MSFWSVLITVDHSDEVDGLALDKKEVARVTALTGDEEPGRTAAGNSLQPAAVSTRYESSALPTSINALTLA